MKTLHWRQDLVDKAYVPSNWSDYLHIKNDTDDESQEQTEPPTDIDPDQPTTSRGTCVPQDSYADSNAVLRLPKSVPKALTIEKGKVKVNVTLMIPCHSS